MKIFWRIYLKFPHKIKKILKTFSIIFKKTFRKFEKILMIFILSKCKTFWINNNCYCVLKLKLKFEQISKFYYFESFWKIKENFNFLLLSKLTLGWYVGCFHPLLIFLGFGGVGKGTFPLFSYGDATGLLWYLPFVHKSWLITFEREKRKSVY